MKKIITVFMRVKKATAWLLIASFLLAFLASCNNRPSDESKDDTIPTTEQTSCNNRPSDESKDDTIPTTEQTENPPSNQISNEEKYKPVLDIYKDVIINLDEKMNSKDSPYSEGTKEYEWESYRVLCVECKSSELRWSKRGACESRVSFCCSRYLYDRRYYRRE